MTSASYFYADWQDTQDLLDYLRVDVGSVLRPWPLKDPAQLVSREEAMLAGRVLVVSEALGEPVFIHKGDIVAMAPTASGVFNRMNLDAARQVGVGSVVDLDASPVLFWTPGPASEAELRVGNIGTQAASPRAISDEYDKWVKQAASWVRRRGTAVWGLQTHAVRPELDIELPFLNSVYALPGALERLTAGARGR